MDNAIGAKRADDAEHVIDHIARRVMDFSDPLPPVRLKPGDRIITPAQAAKLRGISRETLRHMSERGIGPQRIQLSRRRFGYRASDFLDLNTDSAA
jgi:hypothetical protein